ncbi:MAG: DUF6804 family protein [Patescibacteria group bacterium]|jgi:hypothetical protein
MNIKIICLVSGIALLLAVLSFRPYDYYVLLRWGISFSGAITAYGFYKSKLIGWSFIFSSLVFLFNPIFPFYLSKSSWVLIDFVAAILFVLAGFSFKKRLTK